MARSAYSDSNYVVVAGLDDFFEPFGGLWEPLELEADGSCPPTPTRPPPNTLTTPHQPTSLKNSSPGITLPPEMSIRTNDLESDLDAIADGTSPPYPTHLPHPLHASLSPDHGRAGPGGA
jgi:hypothetical protein